MRKVFAASAIVAIVLVLTVIAFNYSTDAASTPSMDASYDSGILYVDGYAPNGYEGQIVTFTLTDSLSNQLSVAYADIGQDLRFSLAFECNALSDGIYNLNASFTKVGSVPYSFDVKLSVVNAINLTVDIHSGILEIAGSVPTSLRQAVMVAHLFDSSYNDVAVGYKSLDGADFFLEIDVGNIQPGTYKIRVEFSLVGHIPVALMKTVEVNQDSQSGFKDYRLKQGVATANGSLFDVPITVFDKEGNQLCSYVEIIELNDAGKAVLRGLKSQNSGVVLLIPNTVSIGGHNYPVSEVSNNESRIMGVGYVSSVVTEVNTNLNVIGKNAFSDANNLTSVYLGEGLKQILGFSMKRTGLSAVELPSSLEFISTGAFALNEKLFIVETRAAESYGELVLMDSSFSYCSSLNTVKLPFGTISLIHPPAFIGSPIKTFDSVNGNDGKYSIGPNGWIYEKVDGEYSKIVFANSVTERLELSEQVKYIGDWAFTRMEISTLVLPSSLISIGANAFENCAIADIQFLGSNISLIDHHAFANNKLTALRIPASVGTLSTNVFEYNRTLTHVTIYGQGDVEVYGSPFKWCPISTFIVEGGANVTLRFSALDNSQGSEITISGVKSFFERPFESMSSLKRITITGEINNIDADCFRGCSSLEDITLTDTSGVYSSQSGVVMRNGIITIIPIAKTSLVLSKPINGIDPKAFESHNKLVSVSFAEASTISEIPDMSFFGCSKLETINIPDAVLRIGNHAFEKCSRLSNISISSNSSLTTIGDYAFKDVPITTFTITSNIVTVGNHAFDSCKYLDTVEMNSNSLKTIGDYAFFNTSLKTLTLSKDVVLGDCVFGDCYELKNLDIEDGSQYSFVDGALYSGSELLFLSSKVIRYNMPSNVTSFKETAFDCAHNLSFVEVSDNSAFSSYKGMLMNRAQTKILLIPSEITHLEIPSTITELHIANADSTFSSLSKLKSFVWKATNVSVNGLRINSESVLLEAENEMFLSSYVISSADTVVVRSNHLRMGYGPISQVSTLCLDIGDLDLLDNTYLGLRTTNLCLDGDDAEKLKSIIDMMSLYSDIKYDKLYLKSGVLLSNQPKYSGEFRYIGEYGVEHAFHYEEGVSVYIQNRTDVLSIDSISIINGQLKVRVSSEQITDLEIVSIDNNQIDKTDGYYIYSIPNGSKSVTVVLTVSETIHYNVVLELNGGTGQRILDASYNSTLNSMNVEDPRKSGHTFVGWFIDDSLTTKFDKDTPIRSDITLYAKWEYNDGKYSVNYTTEHGQVMIYSSDSLLPSGSLLVPNTTIDLKFSGNQNWEFIEWNINGESFTGQSLTVTDHDIYIQPSLRYVSFSNVLNNIVDTNTPKYGEDVVRQWSIPFEVNTSMSIWSGFPSTPAIIDDYIYSRAGNTLYKIDAKTGETVKTVESKLIVNYYLYLGIGGGKIVDYATSRVYDVDLNYCYDTFLPFKAVFYNDGYFYGTYGGKVYKFEAETGHQIKTGKWSQGVDANWFTLYGTTSAPAFVNEHMYLIETKSDGYRGIASIDLENGTKTTFEITTQSNRLLDDGWLTYCNYNGKTILLLPTYSSGLFDIGALTELDTASISAIVVNSDGSLDQQCPLVDLYTWNKSLSALIPFKGRGYIVGSQLYVLDMDRLCEFVLEKAKGTITTLYTKEFESFAIYMEKAEYTHGSIVLSSAYYESEGKVYIYLLPYNASKQAVYIFEDYAGKTEAGKVYISSPTLGSYNSQAVRSTMSGNLVWYSDSGAIYCYGTPKNNPYTFTIHDDASEGMVITGIGKTALEALNNALDGAKLEYNISSSGRIISIDGKEGLWHVESYHGGSWHKVSTLSNEANNVHHTYRITLKGQFGVETIEPSLSDESVTLTFDTSDDTVTISLTGNLPGDVSIEWYVDDPNKVVISGPSDKRDVTIKAIALGTTILYVHVYSDTVDGIANCKVMVIEKPHSVTEELYTFTLRIISSDDAEKADVGTSGFNAMDLSNGIVLSAYGSNAGSALENALNKQGIPCEFYSGGNIKYWVNQIFGLKQFQYPNGDWKYWIQYHDQSTYPESSSYNEWTLGHYTKGGTFDLIYGITNLDGQVVDPGEHGSEDITENPDGSKIIVEIKGDGSSTETTISSDGKTETVVEKDANGNLTSSTVTKKNDDGSIDSTKTNADGSKEIINVSAPETTKADDGTIKTEQITTKVGTDSEGNVTGSSETTLTVVENNDGSGISTQLEISKDANGNTTGSSEMIEVKDANGNITSASEVKKDANGNETYSKVSEFNPENTYKDSDNNDVTEKSSTVTEKDSTGKITIVEESSKKVVKENGEKEIENIKSETTTDPAGKTTSTKTVENIKEHADSTIKSISTETKAADGNESKEKKVEIESKDGNVKSVVEIPDGADKADIITTVTTDSNDGNHAVTKEQIEQAIAIQGKVSDEIKDDVKDHSKVIQIVSSTPDASLTVHKDAIKAASDANSSLRIVSEKGSIAASDTVLSNMLVEEEITISISEAKDEHINDAQRENIPDGAVVVDVRIMAGDKDIGKSLGGLITISIRYTPADGKIGVAYYIDDDGNKVRMGGTYDPIKGEIVFDSTHCSLYMVVDEDPSKSGLSNAAIFVGIAVAVVAAIAVAIMLYVRKH